MPRPLCIALSGGLASGKTTVADLFASRGIEVVDTDQIAHGLTRSDGDAIPAIRDAFGSQALATSGALDRAEMRRRVFSDPHARRQLESILHPMIFEAASKALDVANGPYVLLVVPLLQETWPLFKPLVDRVLLVDCTEETQIRRACTRTGIDATLARAILSTQANRLQRQALADDIIANEDDQEALASRVSSLHEQYLLQAKYLADRLP